MPDKNDQDFERRLAARLNAHLGRAVRPVNAQALVDRLAQASARERPQAGRRIAALAAVTVLLAAAVTVSTIGLLSPSPSATPYPSAAGILPSPSASAPLTGPAVDNAGSVGSDGFWARRGSDLYISTDAGATWSVGTVDASATSIVVLDAVHAWDVTVGPGSSDTGSPTDVLHYLVNRTADGGKTWQSVAIDGNFPAMQAVLSFADVNHGFLLMSRGRFATQDSSVFRTDDGGARWRRVGSAPSLGPMFIALDTQTLWAGAEESPAPVKLWPALSESTDGGATWHEVRLPGDPAYALGPPTFFEQDGVLVTGTEDGTGRLSLLRTTDSGDSWATVHPVQYLGRIGPGSFLNRDLWFMANADGGEIVVVTEQGAKWVGVPTNGLPPAAPQWIGFVDAQRGAALVPTGDSAAPGSPPPLGLYMTFDGGRDWKPANLPSANPEQTATPAPTPNPDGLTATGIGFWDAQHGLMVGTLNSGDGTGAIWRTSDGGATWNKTLHPTSPFSYVAVVGPRYAWAGIVCGEVEVPCSPSLMASTDGGDTWQRVSSEAFVSISFADAQNGWAVAPGGPSATGPVGGASGSVLSSQDGGMSWATQGNPCPTGGMWPVSVSFPDSLHGWIACAGEGGAGTAAKAVVGTTDGGRTWSVRAAVTLPAEPGTTGTIPFSDYLAGIAMRANGKGMAWMGRGTTLRTTDGGRTWLAMPPGDFDVVIASAGAAPTDRDWALLVFDGNRGQQLLETTANTGATWQVRSVISTP
jgi:photosystem II stability/assembly factor-like uncharacterized protein